MEYYILIYKGASRGTSGEGLGTQYDFTHACAVCGTPATVHNNLYGKGYAKKEQDHFCETLNGDYIISEILYNKMLEKGIKLPGLNKVFSKRGPAPYRHFISYTYFPPALPKSKGIQTEGQCKVCHRNGFFGIGFPVFIPYEFYYILPDDSILSKWDVFSTWEHFGNSNLNAEGNKVIRYAPATTYCKRKREANF